MATESFIISGDVNVQVTIAENPDGTLTFTVAVLDTNGTIGDLNAIFFDLADDSRTSSLSIVDGSAGYTNLDGSTGDTVENVFDEDSVRKVDNYTNMNGEVIKDAGLFDAGIQFGSQGIATDDVQVATFTLAASDGPLTLADFSLQDFGVRLTSVGDIDGSRDGSLKLGGTSPEFPEDPPPPPPGPVCDDFLFVESNSTFNPPFLPGQTDDALEGGATSVLANDIGAMTVTSVNGVLLGADDFIIVEGTNGGWLKMYADGTVDFAVNIEGQAPATFGNVSPDGVAMTEFVYTTDNGLENILCVTVTGLGDDGGGGTGGF